MPDRLRNELVSLAQAMVFFGVWIGTLIALKTLILEEYHIDFVGWSKIFVGALILSKVVLVLEHFSLGDWVRARPAWLDVLVRTLLYSIGVAAVLIVEHGLEQRREAGGFVAAVRHGLLEVAVPHLLINVLCLSGALLAYNVLAVIRRHLGPGGLLALFKQPLPSDGKATDATPG